MNWIVTLYADADRDEFIQFMIENGYEFKEFAAIPRVFEIDDPFDHPAIETIEGADWEQTKPAANERTPVTVGPDLQSGDGNWALARIIRRTMPWRLDRTFNTTGIQSFFESGLDGEGVDIYIVDSGIRTTHEEFGDRATSVSDHTGESTLVDVYGHGTSCASLAAGSSIGSARKASLWAFRCFDSAGVGQNWYIVDAINAAIAHYNDRVAENRPAVMNLSLSSGATSVGAAAEAAVAAGIVVVAAAGNDLQSTSNKFPATNPGIITVGGSNAADGSYYNGRNGSNYGAKLDVLAPSQTLRIAGHDGDAAYRYGDGTSYGCAVTTGVVACLLTGLGRLTPAQVDQVRMYLQASASKGLKTNMSPGFLPDRLLYLDPTLTASPIFDPIPDAPEARFWRIFITQNNGDATYTVVGELEFLEVFGSQMQGHDATGPGLGTAIATGIGDALTHQQWAFDNSYDTNSSQGFGNRYWSTPSGSTINQGLGWDFGEGVTKKIIQVNMLADRDALRMPRSFIIQSSSDGVTWNDEWTVTNQTGWTIGQWRNFPRPFN